MLRKITEDVWEARGRVKLMPAVYLPCRTTIIRLGDGRLVLHSPIDFDEETAAEIEALGEVAYLVAPNKVHHLFVEAAQERFPNAKTFGAPGLPAKRDDLSFDGVLGTDRAGFDDLPHFLLEGASAWNEVVFFHSASRSLICTDLLFNIHQTDGWLTPWVLRLTGTYDTFAHSKLWRKQYDDVETFAASVRTMLDWPIDRIIMAHGDVIEQDCAARLESVFEWLFSQAPAPTPEEPTAAAS